MRAKYLDQSREFVVTNVVDFERLPGGLIRIFFGIERGGSVDIECALLIANLAEIGAEISRIAKQSDFTSNNPGIQIVN